MRRLMLGLLLVVACDEKKTATATAPAAAPAAAPAPAQPSPAAPAGEAPKLDPDTMHRTVLEMERRCREGAPAPQRGTDCLVAATAFENGTDGVEKDRRRAQRIYDAACRVHASAPGHELAWFCDTAQRMKNEFAAEAAADAGK